VRIRSIKPEFWRSEDVKRLPREVRLLFIGLWSYVDDNGVGVDDYRQIASDLGPLEDDPVEFRKYVRDGLATLSRKSRDISSGVPLVVRYEVDGKRYLFITGWDHQRVDKPAKPRYPRPPKPPTSGYPETACETEDDSRESRESVAPGTGEQGNRGTGEQKTSAPRGAKPDLLFDRFYAIYPRKREPKDARKAWDKAVKDGANPEDIIAGAERYRRECETTHRETSYIKHPATWLNKGCWMDEEPTLQLVSGGYRPYQDPHDPADYYEDL